MTFFEELKRRKTVRVAIVYLAAAWAVLQVGDIVLPALGAPEWMSRGLVLATLIGLPVALVLAWAFRITPEGVKREVDIDSGPAPESRTTAEISWFSPRAIFAVLTLVVVAAIAGWWVGDTQIAEEAASGQSIAVLPFDDFSAETGQEWFASGMQEALITALQKIGALRVTSRTSTMQYADSDRALPEIAEELDARWLVEGSVTRVEDQIRITAQLIDGETDDHVWADDYSDHVVDILELQHNVARAIAEEIDVALSPDDHRRLDSAPDVEPEVYRAYVLGLDRFFRITPADYEAGVDLFEEAIALDPGFAPAHAMLAVSHATAIDYGWIEPEDGAEAAREAAETAMRLAPDASDSFHAVGSVKYHVDNDFPAAETAFIEALSRGASAYAHQDYAWMLANLGRQEEAIPIVTRATELDPRSPLMVTDLGWWIFGTGRYAESLQYGNRALDLDPRYGEAHWLLSHAHAYLGNEAESLASLDRYEELYGEPLPYFRAYFLAVLGRADDARALIPEIQARIDEGRSHWSELGLVYAALGDTELALEAAERIDRRRISFMPYHTPGWQVLFDEPRFQAVLARTGFPLPPPRP